MTPLRRVHYYLLTEWILAKRRGYDVTWFEGGMEVVEALLKEE